MARIDVFYQFIKVVELNRIKEVCTNLCVIIGRKRRPYFIERDDSQEHEFES